MKGAYQAYQNRRIWSAIKNLILYILQIVLIGGFIIGLIYFLSKTFGAIAISNIKDFFINYIFAIISGIIILVTIFSCLVLDNSFEDKSKKLTLKSGISLAIDFVVLSAISEFIKWDIIQNMRDTEISFLRIADKGSFLFCFSIVAISSCIEFLIISFKKDLSKLTALIPAFGSIITIIIVNNSKVPNYKFVLACFFATIGIIQLAISMIPNKETINRIFYISKGIIFLLISLVTLCLSLASIITPAKDYSTFVQKYLGIHFENGMQIFSLIACVPAILLLILAVFYIRGKNFWANIFEKHNSYSSSTKHSVSYSSSKYSDLMPTTGRDEIIEQMVEEEIKQYHERWDDLDDLGYDGTDIDVSDM